MLFSKMDGIIYITDENNKKRFVQIDIEKYGFIVEDILDRLAIANRKNEDSYPLDDIIEELNSEGNLDRYV
ncbi:MAG: hypothetical protein H6572_01640 [Lewinellaceae bacterium]|nr:hypothetical protein [Lewinellaceae bacterium]